MLEEWKIKPSYIDPACQAVGTFSILQPPSGTIGEGLRRICGEALPGGFIEFMHQLMQRMKLSTVNSMLHRTVKGGLKSQTAKGEIAALTYLYL